MFQKVTEPRPLAMGADRNDDRHLAIVSLPGHADGLPSEERLQNGGLQFKYPRVVFVGEHDLDSKKPLLWPFARTSKGKLFSVGRLASIVSESNHAAITVKGSLLLQRHPAANPHAYLYLTPRHPAESNR